MDQYLSSLLSSITNTWLDLLKFAKKDRDTKFGDDAACAMALLTGDKNILWGEKFLFKGFKSAQGIEGVVPEFRAELLKGAEVDQLFGPTLYHQDPARQVNPRFPTQVSPMAMLGQAGMGMDPMAMAMMGQMMGQQIGMQSDLSDNIARVVQDYQNWSLQEINYKWQSRRVHTEGLIKGMGVWWQELATPIAGVDTATVGSYYGPISELIIDPDATQMEEVTWCARECWTPYWKLEEEYGLPPESMRKYACIESSMGKCADDPRRDYKRANGGTNDLVCYYKIWSKCGIGDRLLSAREDIRGQFPSVGDYVYLVVVQDCPYPLNLSPTLLDSGDDDDVFWALQWPIPFHMDATHGWPFVPLGFRWVPGSVWPQSILKAGFGELKWLHWAMSFLMNNVAEGSGSLCGYKSGLSDDQEAAIKSMGRTRYVKLALENGQKITDIISFINQPNVRTDIWSMIAAVWDQFEKRTGLNELLYGTQTTQSRSATDVSIRNQNASIRIDDLAGTTEDAVVRCARNEAIAMRWLLRGQDVAAAVGPQAAMFWDAYIAESPIDHIVREYDYRIEAGSVRRPNKQQKVDQMNQAVQVWGPVAQQIAMTWGQVGPLNALWADWCKANELDPTPYQVQPPPPPPMLAPPPGSPPPQ